MKSAYNGAGEEELQQRKEALISRMDRIFLSSYPEVKDRIMSIHSLHLMEEEARPSREHVDRWFLEHQVCFPAVSSSAWPTLSLPLPRLTELSSLSIKTQGAVNCNFFL